MSLELFIYLYSKIILAPNMRKIWYACGVIYLIWKLIFLSHTTPNRKKFLCPTLSKTGTTCFQAKQRVLLSQTCNMWILCFYLFQHAVFFQRVIISADSAQIFFLLNQLNELPLCHYRSSQLLRVFPLQKGDIESFSIILVTCALV